MNALSPERALDAVRGVSFVLLQDIHRPPQRSARRLAPLIVPLVGHRQRRRPCERVVGTGAHWNVTRNALCVEGWSRESSLRATSVETWLVERASHARLVQATFRVGMLSPSPFCSGRKVGNLFPSLGAGAGGRGSPSSHSMRLPTRFCPTPSPRNRVARLRGNRPSTMATSMAEMLNQLMGEERDVPLEERTNRVRQFQDPDVCKVPTPSNPIGLRPKPTSPFALTPFKPSQP
jgi:hypothetical protein